MKQGCGEKKGCLEKRFRLSAKALSGATALSQSGQEAGATQVEGARGRVQELMLERKWGLGHAGLRSCKDFGFQPCDRKPLEAVGRRVTCSDLCLMRTFLTCSVEPDCGGQE